MHDKKSDSKKISISELWKGRNSYRKFQDYMYASVGKEYGFDRGETHDFGEATKHLDIEAFKLQEASKSLAKLESDIIEKEQEISERAKVLEPEEHIPILNVKKVAEQQKVNLTRKRFNDIKNVMNSIIYYAIEHEIVEHNHLNDINYRQFAYKPETHDKLPYSEEERKRIMNHLNDDDLYTLAIKSDFCMILRIGELKVLRWDDIKGDYQRFQTFSNCNF